MGTIKKIKTNEKGTIEKVQLADGSVKTVKQVVKALDTGEKFKTKAPDGNTAKVIPVDNRFIRTVGDKEKTDNLKNLPRF